MGIICEENGCGSRHHEQFVVQGDHRTYPLHSATSRKRFHRGEKGAQHFTDDNICRNKNNMQNLNIFTPRLVFRLITSSSSFSN